nr:FAD-dependent monooxygenase [Nonomuraea typhae]
MHHVVIAGAGPVGLFLAGELALAGCSVLVLERDQDHNPPLTALPLGMRPRACSTVTPASAIPSAPRCSTGPEPRWRPVVRHSGTPAPQHRRPSPSAVTPTTKGQRP